MVGLAMSAMATGMSLAGDFDTKFDRRMLLATGDRTPILVGYTIAGVLRAVITGVVLTVVGVAAGMQVDGNVLELLGCGAHAALRARDHALVDGLRLPHPVDPGRAAPPDASAPS